MKGKLHTLLGPGRPALGMRSSPDPSTLGPGLYSRIENMRTDQGTLRVRDGCSKPIASGPSISGTVASELLGIYSGTLNGASGLFAAFWFGGAINRTAVFRKSGGTWAEITSSPTRFAVKRAVGFAVVRDDFSAFGSAGDVLVFGNGDEANRVSPGGSNAYIHEELPVAAWGSATASPAGWFQLTEDIRVQASDAAKLSGSAARRDTAGLEVELNFDPAYGIETVTFLFWRANRLGNGLSADGMPLEREVCVAATIDQGYRSFWDYLTRAEALIDTDPVVQRTVTSATFASPVVVTTATSHGFASGDWVRLSQIGGNAGANGVFTITVLSATTFSLNGSIGTGSYASGGQVTKLEWVSVFDAESGDDSLSQVALASRNTAVVSNGTMSVIDTGRYVGRSGWCGIRFSVNLAFPATTRTVTIPFVGTSGALDGRCGFAVAYYDHLSRAEGVAWEATKGNTRNLAMTGATAGAQFSWEPGDQFHTSYSLAVPGTTALTGSPTYALWYRSDPELAEDGTTQFSDYFYSGHVALPASVGLGFTPSYARSNTRDMSRMAKEVGHRPIPPGALFATANDRLFVAGTSSPGSLWVSADRDPFSFRQVPTVTELGQIDARSATYRTFSGQAVTALLRLQGDVLGVDSVLVWTDRGLYRLGAFDAKEVLRAARLGEIGTTQPASVAAYGGTVWFLDTEGQVRRTNGGLASESMTLGKVDDLLTSDSTVATCAVSGFGGYRLFFRDVASGLNTLCLTWQAITGEWVLDRYPFSVARVTSHETASGRSLLACTDNGVLYELERIGQVTDDGAAITVRVVGPELSDGMWGGLTLGGMGVVMDGGVNTVLTTRRECPYDGTSVEAEIDLSSSALSTAAAWRWDSAGGNLVSTGLVPSGLPSIAGELPGGKRLRTWVIEVAGRPGGPDRG